MSSDKIYPGAPPSKDTMLFDNVDFLLRSTNCYAYAVQDYGSGFLTSVRESSVPTHQEDYDYMPRPGQTTGCSYEELLGPQPADEDAWTVLRLSTMRRALKQDGVLYQGQKYPKHVPDDAYIICCFLEPRSYHFIRQNQDGSWSSKNGGGFVSCYKNDNKTPMDNPEGFYDTEENPKKYTFAGYFLVPKGGRHVGIKKLIENINTNPKLRRLSSLNLLLKECAGGRISTPKAKQEAYAEHFDGANKLFQETRTDITQMRDIFRNIEKNNDRDKANRLFDSALDLEKGVKSKLQMVRPFSLRSLIDVKFLTRPNKIATFHHNNRKKTRA